MTYTKTRDVRVKFRDQLRSIAKFCMNTYAGMTTPTGRPKKVPDFWIRECPVHGYVLTNSGMPKAKREVCGNHMVSPERTRNNSAPRTLLCDQATTLVEEVEKPR